MSELSTLSLTVALTDRFGRTSQLGLLGTSSLPVQEGLPLRVCSLEGLAGLAVPARYQVEAADGALTELELVHARGLAGDRALYLGVALG